MAVTVLAAVGTAAWHLGLGVAPAIMFVAVLAVQVEVARRRPEEELRGVSSEEEWVEAVSDAEQAISREHRMWRAARSARSGDG